MATDKDGAFLSILANALLLAVGLSMLQDARPCLPGSSGIFARTQSIPSTRFGRDSPASSNGTAMNGENAFPIMQIVVASGVNGPPIICLVAAGGFGSFLFEAAT